MSLKKSLVDKLKVVLEDEAKVTAAGLEFLEGLADAVPRFSQHSRVALSKASEIAALSYTVENANSIPEGFHALVSQFEADVGVIYTGVIALRTYIHVRVPEIKEEDNAGVFIQQQLAQYLSKVETVLLGETAENTAPFPGNNAGLTYYAARAEVEGSILGGKEPGTKAPSAPLHLRALDTSLLRSIGNGYAKLAEISTAILSVFAKNAKKINEPRRSETRMIG